MEHKVQQILTEQELHGWYFDEGSARELESELRSTLETVSRTLRGKHPFVAGNEFTPRRANKTQGYFDGCPFTRLKDFNPTSRDQIAWVMKEHYGWKPTMFTDTGRAVIDEVVLKEIAISIQKHKSISPDMILMAKTVVKEMPIISKRPPSTP